MDSSHPFFFYLIISFGAPSPQGMNDCDNLLGACDVCFRSGWSKGPPRHGDCKWGWGGLTAKYVMSLPTATEVTW